MKALKAIGNIVLVVAISGIALLACVGLIYLIDQDSGPGYITLCDYTSASWRVTQITENYPDPNGTKWSKPFALALEVTSEVGNDHIFLRDNSPELPKYKKVSIGQQLRFGIVMKPIKGMESNRYFQYLELK